VNICLCFHLSNNSQDESGVFPVKLFKIVVVVVQRNVGNAFQYKSKAISRVLGSGDMCSNVFDF
jgi:hypothetical protein